MILALLRHAKSSWDASGIDDFARPLNDRGRKAARRIGRELKNRGIRFDQVIASPAVRVRETLDGLAKGYGELPGIDFEDRIYGAGLGTLVEIVRRIPGQVHAPLMVGHNPGFQQLAVALAKDDAGGLRHTVVDKFPTAGFALIVLPARSWDAIEVSTGEIRELILPRELAD